MGSKTLRDQIKPHSDVVRIANANASVGRLDMHPLHMEDCTFRSCAYNKTVCILMLLLQNYRIVLLCCNAAIANASEMELTCILSAAAGKLLSLYDAVLL